MQETTEDTIRRLQNDFDKAELNADKDRLQQLIADDFTSIGPKGFLMNKEEWIGRHAHFKYDTLDASEHDIRLYDKTAIVRNVQHNKARYKDQNVDLTVRVCQVWVQQDGEWRLVAIQFSPMPQD